MNIIVACTPRGIIGTNGRLPWPKCSEDLKLFAKITKGKSVIMGSKTYKSLYPLKSLPARNNFIISRSMTEISTEISLLRKPEHIQDAFIIGGQEIYDEYLQTNWVNTLYLSLFKKEYEGDKVFKIPENFKTTYEEEFADFTFYIKERT